MGGNVWGTDGLRPYARSVMDHMSKSMDGDSIRGWSVFRDGEEVIVQVYTRDSMMHEYHCEGTNHCHKASQTPTDIDFPQDTAITRDWITEGQNDSFNKFEATVRQKSYNAGTLNAYSVWVHEDTGHGHDHGTNIWTEMEYEKITVFVFCHGHAGESGLFCHYRKSPQGGFEDHGDHDDHDSHDHHGHNH